MPTPLRLALLVLLAGLVPAGFRGALSAQEPPPFVLSQLTWFDRAGKALGKLGPLADHGNLEISPDGTRVAVNAFSTERTGLFVSPVSSATLRDAVLADPAGAWPVSWSPDASTPRPEPQPRDPRGTAIRTFSTAPA